MGQYLNANKLKETRTKVKKIFFYRIAGTGMGASACLLKDYGYHVEGYDSQYAPPMGTYLESTGIPLYQTNEVTDVLLNSFDLIVVGNVVPKNSEDAKRIESLNVPYTSFPSAIGALALETENVVGIAGTHGKTTTTYLMMQVFRNLGLNPGYFIGGVLNEGRPAQKGDGSYFFIESDEYDSAYFEKFSKFHSYFINHLVLTSLEFDHADIFNSLQDIEKEFIKLITTVDKSLIFCSDYPNIVKLAEYKKKSAKIIFYGEKDKSGPFEIKTIENGSTFSLVLKEKIEIFKTDLIGRHNIINLTTCINFAFDQGFSLDQIRQAVLHLKMVKRRQEVRGKYKNKIVIDDFAHHPRAVSYTLDSIKKKYPGKKVQVILEPNSATARSSIFQKEFLESLLEADSLILAKPQKDTSVKGHHNLDCHLIAQEYSLKTKRMANVATNLNELLVLIDKNLNDIDVILVMSNGTCLGLWNSSFINELC